MPSPSTASHGGLPPIQGLLFPSQLLKAAAPMLLDQPSTQPSHPQPPAFSQQGAVQYTTYASMTKKAYTTCGAATVTSASQTVPTGTAKVTVLTGTTVDPVPTGLVQLTGAASNNKGLGFVGVAAALVIVVL
ncbi:hypothetical protein BGZ60DRAFT_438497 [Tricladium varicosporioides]|nr:hypothetical protein BGZ60DRAFT_438497 [Hymenoscyphus varicosporioides]